MIAWILRSQDEKGVFWAEGVAVGALPQTENACTPKHFQSRTPVPGPTEIKPTFHYLVVTPATKVLDSSRHF